MSGWGMLALAASAVVAAGCGNSSSSSTGSAATTTPPAVKTVDAQQVEQGIEKSLSTSTITVTNATCPPDVPVKAGSTFTCSLTFSNGATGTATVTQKGAGQYTYTLTEAQVPGSVADQAVEKQLAAQGVPNATVTCPQNVIVKAGTTVTCNVSGAQGKSASTVTFTFSNAEGSVEPSSVKTS